MKSAVFSRMLIMAVVALGSSVPVTASACAVCMGDPSTKTAGAMNGAIFLMLGFVALMLGSVAAFAFYLMRRANAPIPPHAELAATMTSEEDSK